MGDFKSPALVHVYGYRSSLKLDGRFRFRLPEDLSAQLRVEFGRVSADSAMPTPVLSRLAFYLVPGPGERVLLYPGPNIKVAIERFENPSVGADPAQLRQARDYFYSMMRFLEADSQGRILLPPHLRQHAAIEDNDEDVVLTGHNLWLSLTRGSLAAQEDQKGREALDSIGADVLDPVRRAEPPTEWDVQ